MRTSTMGRLWFALRALIRDEEPVLGFFEALLAMPRASFRKPAERSSPADCTPEDLRRMLHWMAEAERGTVGFPSVDVLLGQVVRSLEQADLSLQQRLRGELASHVKDLGDPVFGSALAVAARWPLPEAKLFLLRLLTTRSSGGNGPESRGGDAPAALGHGRVPLSVNGHAQRLDYRTAVIAALGALRDPKLRSLFEMLLNKHLDRGLADPVRLEICREAGVALVLLDPEALGSALPLELSTDVLLLDRLLSRPESEVRRAVMDWVNSRPQPARAHLSEALAVLRGRHRASALIA
ncbi:MAG: hypothetical protein JSU68_01135 [Phycisphaerales bacterium]|nr:MAG: hypothetical protein JSU68_01135 [Phycisphaerales bacterium]